MTLSERMAERAATHDELLVRAVAAVNRGDLTGAHALAEQVLADDDNNLDARTLLDTEGQPAGEVRRITVMFCDLVESTSLSGRVDPELYRSILSRYRKLAASIVTERHGGFVSGFKGDGMLALFGYPTVRGNDTERAVIAGLEIAAEVAALSDQIEQTIGERLSVRAALHRGLLYIDPHENDVYGLAANVAARLEGLAPPGGVVVSDEVRRLVADRFDLEAGEPREVKGLDAPLQPFLVIGRRSAEPIGAIQTPLVGRAAELERIRALWNAAIDPAAATLSGITIVGEPGMGKTRLVAAIADDAAFEDANVVRLAGSTDHQDVGFHPLRRLIESRCGISSGSTAADQLALLEQELESLGFQVADTVALLAPILGIDPDVGYVEADADGRKLTDDIAKAAAEYVVACLGHGPALLVVDDHHAVDEATDDLIDRILGSGRPQTLVLATSRSQSLAGTEVISLGPLPRDACLALIDAIAPSAAGVSLDRAELVERSDGVPLYLEELVRGSGIEPVDPVHRPVRSAASTVPDVLYEPLMARLYASPATIAVASTAATIGRDVDIDLLTESVELPADEVREAVEGLVAGRIFDRDAAEPNSVHFHHQLVREVAYDLIAPSRRREVHARVADVLMKAAGLDERADWTVIANHFERADRPADAANAWREAAEDARRRGLVAEARQRLGAAIDQTALLPPGPERNQHEVELRLQRGYLASAVEGMSSPDASLDHERCLELTLNIPHAPNLVSTLTAMWGYYTSRADLQHARQLSATLKSLISEDWGAFWRPQNIASFAMLDWFEGDFVRADEQLQLAVDSLYARETFDVEAVAAWYLPTHPTVAMHVYLALSRFMTGDTVSADEHAHRSMEFAKDLPFPQGPWSAAYVRCLLGWMMMERGEHDRSFELLGEASAISERHGYDVWSLAAMTQHAATTAARELASPTGASTVPGQAILGSLIQAWQEVDLRSFLTIYVTMLGRMAFHGGDGVGAQSHYAEALELARSTGMHFYDAETLRCQAHVAGDSADILRGLDEALSLARRQGARPFELRIALDLYELRGEAALADLRAAVDGFRADASYAELDRARAHLVRLGR